MAVTPDGKLTVAHDPIPVRGWPPMRMEFDVAGFDPDSVRLHQRISFHLAKDAAAVQYRDGPGRGWPARRTAG
jgi:Cu(I)/Ag(I) efflux system membrane fusion protein